MSGAGCAVGRLSVLLRCWPNALSKMPTLVAPRHSRCGRRGLVLGRARRRTLQFLHLQTKLASPRLPDCSFCSYGTKNE